MNLPDYETLLARCLDAVPDGIDKREGSLIHMAAAPVCLRIAEAYAALAGYYDLVFSDTSSGEYLDRLTAQYGVFRKPASRALRRGRFLDQTGEPMEIPPGSRFCLDSLFFRAETRLDAGEYTLRCETPGSAGNRCFGELLPAEYLPAFGSAELLDVLIPGEEEEDDLSLREKIAERLSAPAFGGNIADYHEKVRDIPGVGAVRVVPAASGGGTVRLTVLDGRFLPPEPALLASVRQKICGEGGGLGLAPIGHTVEVTGADGCGLAIQASVVQMPDADSVRVKAAAEEAVELYFRQLRSKWEEGSIIVRISALTSRILSAEGVSDVHSITVNGKSQNFLLTEDAVPIFDREHSLLNIVAD